MISPLIRFRSHFRRSNDRFVWIILLCGFANASLSGQVCSDLFPYEEGTILVYNNISQGKPSFLDSSFVKDVKMTGDEISWKLTRIMTEPNGRPLPDVTECSCKDSTFYQVPVINTAGTNGSRGWAEKKKPVEYPHTPMVGQVLQNGGRSMELWVQGKLMMSMKVSITDRRVSGYTDITTPAGTFNCYKVEQSHKTLMDKQKKETETRETLWISPGAGLVRMETSGDQPVTRELVAIIRSSAEKD